MRAPSRLSDCPVFITNAAATLDVATEILHELETSALSEDDQAAFHRAMSVLSILKDSCELFVSAVESGPDYK